MARKRSKKSNASQIKDGQNTQGAQRVNQTPVVKHRQGDTFQRTRAGQGGKPRNRDQSTTRGYQYAPQRQPAMARIANPRTNTGDSEEFHRLTLMHGMVDTETFLQAIDRVRADTVHLSKEIQKRTKDLDYDITPALNTILSTLFYFNQRSRFLQDTSADIRDQIRAIDAKEALPPLRSRHDFPQVPRKDRRKTQPDVPGRVDMLFISPSRPGSEVDTLYASPSKSKSPSPAKSKAASPAKSKSPSPAKSKSPSPTKSKAASPAKSKAASPAKSKSPSPAKSKAASPSKSKSPSPTKSKAASPAKSKSPSPAKSKAASTPRKSPSPPRKTASPTKSSSPAKSKVASPPRKSASPPPRAPSVKKGPSPMKSTLLDELVTLTSTPDGLSRQAIKKLLPKISVDVLNAEIRRGVSEGRLAYVNTPSGKIRAV